VAFPVIPSIQSFESLGKVKTPKFIPNDRKYDGLWMWNSE
jgi:hypothetical protein